MADHKRRSIRSTEAQSVTFVELFFDLVFVFAVTQLTVLTAHDLTPEGILRSILLGWLIWWAWTQFTWTLNPADTTHPTVRIVTLAATGMALIMAASVPRAFADDALWFAIPYVLVRVLGLGLQVRVDLERIGVSHTGVLSWAGLSCTGLVLVIVGSVVDADIRPWVWLLAIVADPLQPRRFATVRDGHTVIPRRAERVTHRSLREGDDHELQQHPHRVRGPGALGRLLHQALR